MPAVNDVTRVCAIVGDADHCAPHEEIRLCFERYPGAHVDESTGVHVIPDQPHVVSETSIALGLRFLRRCLGRRDARDPTGPREPRERDAAALDRERR